MKVERLEIMDLAFRKRQFRIYQELIVPNRRKTRNVYKFDEIDQALYLPCK